MGATAAIATFIANTSTRDFPQESGEKAKKAIADTFAAIVAGAGSEVAEPLHRYLGAAQASGFEKRSSGSRGLVEVEVRLRDGRSDRIRVERAPGSPARELSWNDLHAKFMDCARQSQRVSESAANEAFEAIQKLEQIEDITQVTDLLR